MPPQTKVRFTGTCRLIPSRFPSTGILDRVASPADLPFVFELESWTNDRISAELGVLHRLPEDEWVTGKPMSTVVMAAYCHPRPGGGRFNTSERGAWYAGKELDTAHAEVVYHRGRELAEVGVTETRLQMRLYLADFDALFHDVRARSPRNAPFHDPSSYEASQALARDLLAANSNGVIYRSVRHPGGTCIACFRPKLVRAVRAGAYFEYHWRGGRAPVIRKLNP
jgi:RES domain-containing protein